MFLIFIYLHFIWIDSRFSSFKLDFRSMNLRNIVSPLKNLSSLLGLFLIKIKIHIYTHTSIFK